MVAPAATESIRVEIEPQNSEIRIPITDRTRVTDVIRKVHDLCRENPNVDLGIWARQRVGTDRPTWRLFRKGENNQVLAPNQRLHELQPPITTEEEFLFDVEPIVGTVQLG